MARMLRLGWNFTSPHPCAFWHAPRWATQISLLYLTRSFKHRCEGRHVNTHTQSSDLVKTYEHKIVELTYAYRIGNTYVTYYIQYFILLHEICVPAASMACSCRHVLAVSGYHTHLSLTINRARWDVQKKRTINRADKVGCPAWQITDSKTL